MKIPFSILIISILFNILGAKAQLSIPKYPKNSFSTYYWQRASLFDLLPKTPGSTIFIGDSITDGGEWATSFNDVNLLNFGISGDITTGLINRLNAVVAQKPKKVFILIGVNDLAKGISVDEIFKNISFAAKYIKQESVLTQVYVQSVLPVNENLKLFASHTSKAAEVLKLNGLLQDAASANNYNFVNLFKHFADETGRLKTEYTNDGLHLTGAGYALWKHLVYPYVYDLQAEPSLIPTPKTVFQTNGLFPIYKVKQIAYSTDSLQQEAIALQKVLATQGINATLVRGNAKKNQPFIQLITQASKSVETPEAYELTVDTNKVLISAYTKAGIFYGVQSLKQLSRDGYFVKTVKVVDKPAFAWRGYMVDVARNYQSIELLKQQIDAMAAYKLNVFHMHLTEDIAWRLQSKKYPELTAAKNMERNKGMFYSEAEIKDLIKYCKDRHILFLPEIDMPGHSAAFKRTFKVDMQSDSGLVLVKNIVKEFFETYDLPYLHIGADEVKITNKNFLPEISNLLLSLNKKIVGWEPGGNFHPSTVRQLWMDEAGIIGKDGSVRFVDSRHLYLNHMDPLESVVTIFNRQLAGLDQGNKEAMGAIICVWPDRAIGHELDAIKMNGVYPAMLAFAERSWEGKGYKPWVANLTLNGSQAIKDFAAFEDRLMDHKKTYFADKIFTYQKQSDLKWSLYGPFDNGGKVATAFEPENKSYDVDKENPALTTTGGTIVLRHWWAPKIKGTIDNPKPNTTWYAFTKIWSDEDTTKDFWIGFNNFSRSQAVDSPPIGQWDRRGAKVWVNDLEVAAPIWLHGGQLGDLEMPLVDEGYEFRIPTKIALKKGWNIVKIKTPMASFNGRNWHNPEKWMFTFVEVKQ